jgi:DNA-binding response OmpR family regulator
VNATQPIVIGAWSLLPVAGDVRHRGQLVATLSQREEELLCLLIEEYPLPLTMRSLSRLMGLQEDDSKVYVHRVRVKTCHNLILAQRRRGYRFNPDALPDEAPRRSVSPSR